MKGLGIPLIVKGLLNGGVAGEDVLFELFYDVWCSFGSFGRVPRRF